MTIPAETDTASPAATTAKAPPQQRWREEGRMRFGASPIALITIGVASVFGIFGPFTSEMRAACALVFMLVLILARVPIGIAMIVPGVIGVYALRGMGAAVNILSDLPFTTSASWSMSVIPLFIFMGTLLWKSGITDDLFHSGELLLGRRPGGLAVATNAAGAGIAAVTGSTIASTYTLARSALPGMLRAKYSPRIAVASIMAAGLPGQLIPPSVMLVIYAGLAEVPVGPQLLAGIVPGLLFTAGFSIAFYACAKVTGTGTSENPAFDQPGLAKKRLRSIVSAWPLLPIMLIVIGGMYTGMFTATEAAAVASLVALVLTVVRRGRAALGIVVDAAKDALISTGAIFLLMVGAHAISLMVTVSKFGALVTDTLVDLGLGRIGLLLVLVVFYLILGMFMDTMAMMLVTVPLLAPVMLSMDVSLIWFGVFVCILGELALLTPPVGILSYLIYDVVKDPEVNLGHRITLKDVFLSAAIVIPVALLIVAVLILFPALGMVGS